MNNSSFKTQVGILFLMLLLSASTAFSQNFEFGLRFMPTFSSVDINTSKTGRITTDLTAGYGFGALVGVNFHKHVGIQAEVIYNQLSQKYSEPSGQREVKLNYVNIPLLLSLNTDKSKRVNLNIVGGPQLGLSVNSSITAGTDSTNAVLSVKKGDIGLAYGAGLDFGLNSAQTIRLGVGFRGVFGLIDISDNNQNLSNDDYYVFDKTKIKSYSGYIGVSVLF